MGLPGGKRGPMRRPDNGPCRDGGEATWVPAWLLGPSTQLSNLPPSNNLPVTARGQRRNRDCGPEICLQRTEGRAQRGDGEKGGPFL